MLNFSQFLSKKTLTEAQVITTDQAKQQILQILQSLPMDTVDNATNTLNFINQLMTKGTQAMPELANLYKQSYPKLQQLQGQSQQQPNSQQ